MTEESLTSRSSKILCKTCFVIFAESEDEKFQKHIEHSWIKVTVIRGKNSEIIDIKCRTCNEIISILDDSHKGHDIVDNYHNKEDIQKAVKEYGERQNQKPNELKIDSSEDIVGELVGLLSKTIKGDENYIKRILFNGLSCFMHPPSHLLVMEKTSEGKTYPVMQIAQYFPKDNVLTLGGVTPEAFKYQHGILVNDNNEPIQAELDKIEKDIEKAELKKEGVATLNQKKRELIKNAKTLVDLRNKWIIFKEPPHHVLLEKLYSTLSSDELDNEFHIVNKTKGGGQEGFKIVLRGTPAILICSARDESKNERWFETASRFELTSPISSPEKYKGGMKLIGYKFGLPLSLYKKKIISDEDRKHIKDSIEKLIILIKSTNGYVFNPFTEVLNDLFPHEEGIRWRQYARFQTLMNLHCFCYSHQRPRIEIDEVSFPIVTINDIVFANGMIENSQILPPAKLKWFTDVFIPCFKSYDNHPLRISEIVDYMKNKGMRANTRQIRQVNLDPLELNGFIEKSPDPDHKGYWLWATRYIGDESGIKSPIDKKLLEPQSHSNSLDSLGPSCVNVFVKREVGGNPRISYLGKSITLEELSIITCGKLNSLDPPNFESKNPRELMESEGIRGNPKVQNGDPLLQTIKELGKSESDDSSLSITNNTHFICETCDEGPFGLEDSTKLSGSILDFHKKLGHTLKYMTSDESNTYIRNRGSDR